MDIKNCQLYCKTKIDDNLLLIFSLVDHRNDVKMFTTLQWHHTPFHLSFKHFDVIAMVYKGEDHMETYYLFINYLPLIYCFFMNRPRVTVNVTVDTLVNHVLFPLILMQTPTNGSQFHQHLQFSVLGLLIQSYTLRRVIFYLPLEVCTFCNFKKIATWTLERGGWEGWVGEGSTPLFGLDGYVPLSRVWFSGSWLLNRVFAI